MIWFHFLKRWGVIELKDLLWTAPEILRLMPDRPPLGTQKGDVYSFGIIIQELITESKPYDCVMKVDKPLDYESENNTPLMELALSL